MAAPATFAKRVFLIAGVTGMIELVPLYFLEHQIGVPAPPAMTHLEWFYGFIGVAIAFQLVFLVISRDPIRYRPLMLPAVVEKLSFVLPCAILFGTGRLSSNLLLGPSIDAAWLVLFLIARAKTPAE